MSDKSLTPPQNDKQRSKQVNPALLAGAIPPPRNTNRALPPGQRLKVATYQDPYARLRRQSIYISLVFILPVVSIIAIILLVMAVLGSAPSTDTVEAQPSKNLLGIPLPGGMRLVSSKMDEMYVRTGTLLNNIWIPNYDAFPNGSEVYNTSRKVTEIKDFYDNQLVKNNKWQLIKGAKLDQHTFYLYGRGTGDPKVIETLLLDIETLTETNIQSRAGLLDSKAKIGDNVALIYKHRLVQRG